MTHFDIISEMNEPVYFKQENDHTCSLAVLRMVLHNYGQTVSENELIEKANKEYGRNFKNIDNKFIVQLASEYNIETEFTKISVLQIIKLLEKNYLIQCSIRMKYIYKNKSGLHSILLYNYNDNVISYHDPLINASLLTSPAILSKALTGNVIIYKK